MNQKIDKHTTTSIKILAIDTSCDETSVAVTQNTTVLSNIVASQVNLHKPYGGVYPTIAKQAHKEKINLVIQQALKRASIDKSKLDAIAVTVGPGLAPALEVGIQTAERIAKEWNKPLIAVNHIEGHVLSVLAKPNSKKRKKEMQTKFPVLSVVVSGGHTEFILIEKIGKYRILGQTIDDAAGECLDKVGRMINLGYPAGPVIEKIAKLGNPIKFKFPLPMTTTKNFNLSYSGIKTFSKRLINDLEKKKQLKKQTIFDLCASLQTGIFRHIIYKLNKLLIEHPVNAIWLGGGVANNTTLRKTLRQSLKQKKLKLTVPYTKKLCSDNAAMIGIAAYYKHQRNEFQNSTKKIDRAPQWKIDEL